ncbi:MAG: DNA repair protein RadA [Candidatus Cloacimonadaceae bacterium]
MASVFVCTDCGFETAKWSGKCPNCGSWDTLKEVEKVTGKTARFQGEGQASLPTRLSEIKSLPLERMPTGVSEFDVVLGGGIVPGMVILLGGEPGVGKSTLMLQLSDWLAKQGKKVVYFSGEESADQINLRAKRLKISSENIWLACTNDADNIINQLSMLEMEAAIIDSIQSVGFSALDSIPGSITQLKECCSQFVRIAKQKGIPLFLVGHVTKDGLVAGPKLIEHMVDTVLYFEGEVTNQYKMLRAAKNRFGSTNELGLFEMTELGLQQLNNPNQMFLSANPNLSGSALGCMIEGTRAFIVEVQALATNSNFGTPQRVAVGLEQKKLALLLAILEKNLSIYMRTNDVFINMTGGIKALDPAIDLAIITAVLSSLKDMPVPEKSVFIGEVSLNGEIRPVDRLELRIKEAKRLGYQHIYISSYAKRKADVKVHPVKHIREISRLFGSIETFNKQF